jgi:hypothetical protein
MAGRGFLDPCLRRDSKTSKIMNPSSVSAATCTSKPGAGKSAVVVTITSQRTRVVAHHDLHENGLEKLTPEEYSRLSK